MEIKGNKEVKQEGVENKLFCTSLDSNPDPLPTPLLLHRPNFGILSTCSQHLILACPRMSFSFPSQPTQLGILQQQKSAETIAFINVQQ